MLTVVYWDLRGLGEAVHLMLEYLGIEYERKIFKQSEGKDPVGNLKGPWLKAKTENAMGLDYPNLPYVVDGDVTLSQSWAILKHIARKGKINPQTEQDKIRCDVTEGAITDFQFQFVSMCYSPTFNDMKGPFLDGIPQKLAGFEKILSKRKWLTGDQLAYVDFRFAELLDHVELCFPGCLDNLTSIKKYKTNFESLPKIAAYKKSSRFQKWPLNGARASWGGKNEEA